MVKIMKYNFYDKITRKTISKKIAHCRIKLGLKQTIMVYMKYSDFEKLINNKNIKNGNNNN
jgi:hypothetical protein